MKMSSTKIHPIRYLVLALTLISCVNGLHKFVSLPDTRIVGGVETTISQVPYLVNLRRDGQFSCGGSLVTSKCVLTAAHCVQGVSPSSLAVHAGATKLSESGQVGRVEQYYVSPFYSALTLDMDVAIIKLANALAGPDIATISPCTTSPDSDQFVQVSGWGITSEYNKMPPDQVSTTSVRIVPKTDCMEAYAGKAILTSTMFCATVPGERDSCSGDSGGPVVYGGRVCGIVSWGFGCARQDYPGVYTKVASRRVSAFINRSLMQHCV